MMKYDAWILPKKMKLIVIFGRLYLLKVLVVIFFFFTDLKGFLVFSPVAYLS